MGKYLELLSVPYEKNEVNEVSGSDSCAADKLHNHEDDLFRLSRLFRTFQEIERRCPAYVPMAVWKTAVEDGRRFLAKWGTNAEALGWTEHDLFGLHKPPAAPSWRYTRLGRTDVTGLIWLLRGRSVITLTEHSAAIAGPTGTVTYYRRR